MDDVEGATRITVEESELLYRGIVIDEKTGIPRQIKWDKNTNKYRLSSAAFHDSKGKLSVDIASKTTPQESLQRLEKSRALACIMAKHPIDLGYCVIEDPIKNNPAHALILSGEKEISKKHQKKLAQKCQWAIPPKDYQMLEPTIG
jgi:hypothetical protein